MNITDNLPLLDQILNNHRDILGAQYLPYKNHCYRMVNFCLELHPCEGETLEKIMIAAAFHDLGIWPNDIVDYLPPSIELSQQYLKKQGKSEWIAEISEMIDQHHKFRSVQNCISPLTEVMRKADWIDVSFGIRRFGLNKAFYKAVCAYFPNLGFHKNLTRLTKEQFMRSPLNPLPMMKW